MLDGMDATCAEAINMKLLAVDHSARTSMKSAANCVNWCELQDTLIIDISNANGGQGSLDLGCVRLRVVCYKHLFKNVR